MSESWERLQGALTYIDHGWRVLPVAHIIDGACSCKRANCAAPGKHPVLSKWPEAASVDGAQVQRWWTSRKSPNVGIATGQGSGLVVLDIDPRHGGNEALAALIAEHGPLPPTPVCRTGGGGEHYYFAAPAEPLQSSAGLLGRGLDIRADGGMVVAPPSIHASGTPYVWSVGPADEDPAPIPPWLLARVVRTRKKDLLGKGPVGEGGRSDWLASRAGHLRGVGFDGDEIEAALALANRSRCKPPLGDDEVHAIAHSIARKPSGDVPKDPDDWRRALKAKVDKNGNPRGYVQDRLNLRTVLSMDPRWEGRIWLDAAREVVMVDDDHISDVAAVDIACWCAEHYDWGTLPIATVLEAVSSVANKNKRDPLRAMVEGATWDGEARLDTWLERAIGAEPGAHARRVARLWLIQAIARALDPGCQADTVLVLVGQQGVGKSTLLRLLAGPGWFKDSVFDMSSKDRFTAINSAWIYEVAELASFSRSRSDRIKAFVSSREDSYRAPFARATTTHKRRTVIVATTNEGEFLSDSTGSRRFWPLTVVGPLDRKWIEANRIQLIAEAAHAYQAGARWHLDVAEEVDRTEASAQHEEQDPWLDEVLAWAGQRPEPVTSASVLVECLGMPRDRLTKNDQMRVGRILSGAGYTKATRHLFVRGVRRRARCWVQPDSGADVIPIDREDVPW